MPGINKNGKSKLFDFIRILRTALFVAVTHRNRAIFDLLIEHDQLDVNVLDKDGHSILEFALFEAVDLDVANELLRRGADIDFKDSNGKLCNPSVISVVVYLLNGHFRKRASSSGHSTRRLLGHTIPG